MSDVPARLDDNSAGALEGARDVELLAAELTPRQRACADHYAVCLNKTRAAELAGYEGDDRTLAVTGHRTLALPHVKRYLQAVLDEQHITAEEVIARLAVLARADFSDFHRIVETDEGFDVELDLSRAEARGVMPALKSFDKRVSERVTPEGETVRRVTYRVRLHSPVQALKELSKILELTQTAAGPAMSASERALLIVAQKAQLTFNAP